MILGGCKSNVLCVIQLSRSLLKIFRFFDACSLNSRPRILGNADGQVKRGSVTTVGGSALTFVLLRARDLLLDLRDLLQDPHRDARDSCATAYSLHLTEDQQTASPGACDGDKSVTAAPIICPQIRPHVPHSIRDRPIESRAAYRRMCSEIYETSVNENIEVLLLNFIGITLRLLPL